MTDRYAPVKGPGDPDSWVSKRMMLAVLDVTDQTFDRSYRPWFPAEYVRKRNGRLEFYGRGCIEAYMRHKAGAAGAEAVAVSRSGRGSSVAAGAESRTCA